MTSIKKQKAERVKIKTPPKAHRFVLKVLHLSNYIPRQTVSYGFFDCQAKKIYFKFFNCNLKIRTQRDLSLVHLFIVHGLSHAAVFSVPVSVAVLKVSVRIHLFEA